MNKIYYSLLLFFVLSIQCWGQQHRYNWKLGLHAGLSNYYGDLSHQIWDLPHVFRQPIQDLNFLTYGLSIEYHVSPSFGLRLLGSKSQFKASDRSYSNSSHYNRALNVQTDLIDVSLLGVVYLDNDKLFKKNAFISPYFIFGGGLTHFDPKGDLLSANHKRYYYWSDQSIRTEDEQGPNASTAEIIQQDHQYETSLSSLKTEGVAYQPITWNVALGLGVKLRLSQRFHLHLEALLRYTGSDFLDDVQGNYLSHYQDNFQAYAANPSNQQGNARGHSPNMNDWYSSVGLSLHYSFGQKTYAIRPAIIYTTDLLPVKENTVIAQETVKPSDQPASNSTNPSIHTPTILAVDSIQTDSKPSVTTSTPDSLIPESTIVKNTKVNSLGSTPSSIAQDSFIKDTIVKVSTLPDSINGLTAPWQQIHQMELQQQQQKYHYELQLQKQQFEQQLMQQQLLHELEREKERVPSLLQQQKFDADLKMLEQKHQYQLKLLELQYLLKIEQLKQGKDSLGFHTPLLLEESNTIASNSTTSSSKSEDRKPRIEQTQLNPLEEPAGSSNAIHKDSIIIVEKTIVEPTTTILLSPNLDQQPSSTASKDTVVLLQENNINSSASTQVLDKIKAEQALLKLKIQELSLQQQLAASRYKDSISIIQKDANKLEKKQADALVQTQTEQGSPQQNLLEQLQRSYQTNQAQQQTIDSLQTALSLRQNSQNSGTLEAFLDKKQASHITKIYFDVGKSSLTVQAKETLTTLLHHLEPYPKVQFWIKGFASKTGNSLVNQRLSAERAIVVAHFLKQTGIASNRIKTTPLGEQNSQSNHELDRRAEVHLSF